ncbi:MAG TPA: efflux RND transporter periplasmic adaptor subunit [Bryobacteraceae bacterium]|jgi:cobalt-zinc-cadmium efflux system membrane fusion protein
MTYRRPVLAGVALLANLLFGGCGAKEKIDEAAAAPPKTQVIEQQPDLNLIKVDQPERFRLVAASEREELPQIHATGAVSPDIEKSFPVVSLASGRVVGIYAKLGDDVKKGQLLLKILSNDITTAFQNYAQTKADEQLARTQLERANLLYGKGAISLNEQQVAEDTEQKAKVALNAAAQQIRTLGADIDHEDPVISVYAPDAGTIVEQNVVNASNVHTPDNQANLFTIADLSRVWVICDVYENDLPMVRLGDRADIQLNAYPDRTFRGTVSNIGKILDPGLRTAKVRIEFSNPGIMRAGMFVTATFYGQHGHEQAVLPSSAVLHLHDRDWVFVPAQNGQFRRMEITSGRIDDRTQVVLAGLSPGQQVVENALALNAESQQ